MSNNKNNKLKKIFVLQGPNFNLLKSQTNNRLTQTGLNKHLKKEAQQYNISINILQTNEEGKALGKIQQQRKKIMGIIIYPGPWSMHGYVLLDLLEIIKIPYIIISIKKENTIFKGVENLFGEDLLPLTSKALNVLNKIYEDG